MRDDAGADDRRAISPRSIVIGLALGIPLSLLFLWLAVRGVDLNEVWAALSRANVVLVLIAVPFVLMLYVTQGFRWRHLVVAPSLPRRRAFVVLMFVGLAITNVIPGRPGDVARGIWLSRLGRIPMARSLTSVGVDRALDVGTVFVVLLLCLPFIERPDWLNALAIAGAAVSVLAIGVLLAAWLRGRGRRDQDFGAALERGGRSWWRYQASGIARGLDVLSRPADFALATAYSFLGWGFNAVGAWIVGESLGLNIGIAGAMLVTSVIALGSAIPSSPGMIGTFQWLSVASLAVIGVGRADALAFSILYQATWYIPTTLSGVPGSWWLTREGRRAGASAAA